MSLLDVTKFDREFYETRLKDFLPDTFIDCHTHLWLSSHSVKDQIVHRSCNWPSMVAKENSVEDLNETNVRGKKRKGVIDTLSAQIILQNFIDSLA